MRNQRYFAYGTKCTVKAQNLSCIKKNATFCVVF